MELLAWIFTVLGNKGGVGKSFISILLADYIIRHLSIENLIIGDAEMSNLQRTFYTTMTNCGLIDPKAAKIWEMNNARQFDKFLDDCSMEKGKTCIVDTGASMMEILTRQIDAISDTIDEANLGFNLVFVAGPSDDSERAAKSLIVSLKNIQNIKTHFVLLDASDSMTMDNYAIYKTGLVKTIERAGMPIHYMGKVPECIFSQIMREDKLPPCKLLERYENQRFARKRVCRWLNDVSDPIMSQILSTSAE